MNRLSPSKFLRINIGLLRRFQIPTSAFDLYREGAWKSYSGVFPQVHKLIEWELITWIHTDHTGRGSGVKKFWVLTERGRRLLELFPEEDVDDGLSEAAE